MRQQHDTLIIGGGQAGLAAGHYLTQQNRDYAILEKARIGESWRSGKWDSFTLVTPNYMLQLPDMVYNGDRPDGFLGRDEVVNYFDAYVDQFQPLVRTGVEVTKVTRVDKQDRFLVESSAGPFEASNIIVATGTFQEPRIPPFAEGVPRRIQQLHSSEYRNPNELPSGAVLVVGAAQSGCQIADELAATGRTVYLCTGKANRLPRRYRGHDSFWWADQLGIFDQTVDDLPTRKARFAPNPQVSGANGGKTLSLHSLARQGVHLLGRMTDVSGSLVSIGDDLNENIAGADEFATNFKESVDSFIEKSGMRAPEEERSEPASAYDTEAVSRLDLDEAEIGTIIWATGYDYDYSWIDFPVFDDVGYPDTNRGVTAVEGLYFVGLHFLHTRKSGLLLGVGDDARHVTEALAARDTHASV
jgi:putative flavoprotein involved in K+ transport